MAVLGLIYFNGGIFDGNQVIPADWVHDSLKVYSEVAWITKNLGRYFKDLGYGYQCWSARVGNHHLNFAWGYGSQLIVLPEEIELIIITTAAPLNEIPPADGW